MGDPDAIVVPSIPLSKDYSIHAVPDVTSVTPGAKMTYICLYRDGENYPTVWSADYQGIRDHFSWYLIPESAVIRSKSTGETEVGQTLSTGVRWQRTWDEDPGKYVVACAINRYTKDEKWCFLGQRVTPLDAVLSRMWHDNKEAPKQADKAVSYWQGHIDNVKLTQEKFPGSIDFSNPDQAAKTVPPNSVYASQLQAYKMEIRDGNFQRAQRIAQNANENFRKERQDQANQTIHELEKYRDKLAEILEPTEPTKGKTSIPFKALHYGKEDQQPTWLNVFVCKMDSIAATPETKRYSTFGGRPHYETVPAQPAKQVWRLVDWSFPTRDDLPKQFDEYGETDAAAIDNLFDSWNHYKNKYPPGRLQYQLILPQLSKAGGFETDGTTRWDHVVHWLEIGATAALLVTGVGFLCGPAVLMFGVTGEVVASTGTWVFLFSSTAAATINIVQRQELGIGSWTDNLFDGLTIVGNMLTGIGTVARVARVAEMSAARAAWARGAYVEFKDISGTVIKGCLIGQVGDNMIQGVIVVEEYMKEYDAIIHDPNMSPEERVARLVTWSRNLAMTGLMTFMSAKSSATDIQAINQEAQIAKKAAKFSKDPIIVQTPKEKLDMVADPTKRVEITTKPVTEGKVVEPDPKVKRQVTTHTTTAEIPGRAGELSGPSKVPPPPNQRGLTVGQDQIFATMAQDKKQIILVRDANPAAVNYYGKPGYGPKPETLKAKTAKGGAHIGLATADPSDQRLVDMLMADSHVAGTTLQEKYNSYMAKLEEKGYKVAGPGDDYVVTNADYTKGFYSDCDLHGVYNADGSNAWLSDSQAGEMNQQFGPPTIMHGPQDNWTQRLNPEMGPNAGPQGKGVTAYMPDGSTVHINSNDELKAFYKKHNIDWDKIWQGKY